MTRFLNAATLDLANEDLEGWLISTTPSTKVQKLVVGPSGNLCANPTCRRDLSDTPANHPGTILGELAHVKGEKKGAARYDAQQPDGERNGAGNLIYLCATCHTLIDGQPTVYTVESILAMKAAHEAWVRQTLQIAITAVTFHELETVCMGIAGLEQASEGNFSLTPLAEKMSKNGLTSQVHQELAIGLVLQPKVQSYITTVAKLNDAFPERLRAGFVEKYNELLEKGLIGDSLFYGLVEFAGGKTPSSKRHVAGLAVLSHLFAICEVFER